MTEANRFRFRAYSNKHNRMLTWDESERQVMIYTDIDINSGMTFDVAQGGFELDGEITLMQSTGLLDSEGTEIFEGDIVKAEWGLGNPVQDVEMRNFFWCRGECLIDEDSITVIGNIHENPELLNETTKD
jgi:uncharacterized phage protein (TIGR01671 family)